MIKCAVCDTNITDGSMCKKCGRLFCNKEKYCIVCNKELEKIKIKSEFVYDYPIDWFVYNEYKIGLKGFSILPRHLLLLLDILIPNNIKIVFFSSKKLSKEFADAANNYMDLDTMNNIPFSEKSRYSMLLSPVDEDIRYVLFNTFAIKIHEFGFLLKLLIKTQSYIDIMNDLDTSKIRKTMGEILWTYNEKLGIPFIIFDNEMKLSVNSAEINIITNYIEFKSLLDVVNIENLYLLFDHFSHKIKLNYEVMKSKNRFSLIEVISTLLYYIYLNSVKVYTNKWIGISFEISEMIDKHHAEFMEILKNNDDLCSALDYVISNDHIDFSSYEQYEDFVMIILKESMNMIKPLYDVPEETIQIFRIGEIYQKNLRTGIELNHFKLGSPSEYATLLKDICYNENANPTIRLMAGQSVEQILLEDILSNYNYLNYIGFFDHSIYFADLIIKLLPKINEKAKIFGYDNVIRYDDAADTLLILNTMSETYNDPERYNTSNDKLLKIIQKYDLKPALLMNIWKEYIKTHNIENMKEIHKIFLSIDLNKYGHIEPITKVIGYLSFYLIEKYNRINNINKVIDTIEDLFNPEMEDIDRMLKNYILFNDLIHLFKIVVNATNSDDYFNILNKSKPYIYSIYEQSAPIEPIKSFAMKTEILIHFLNENNKLTIEYIDKLMRFQKSIYIEEFCNEIKYWLNKRYEMKGRLIAALKPKRMRDLDPWEEFLENYIEKIIIKELENSILTSDAILIVEGETDEIIFNEFIKKVIPKDNIYLINAEGYNNLLIMQREMKIINKFNIPIYSIFDGDTLSNKKMKAIRKKIEQDLKINQDRSFTLKHKSIEHYLLIPKAIKKAFKKIELSEKEITEKIQKGKNKKYSLDKLLKSENIGKYDKEKAELIAKNMTINDIDQEIKSILFKLKKTT